MENIKKKRTRVERESGKIEKWLTARRRQKMPEIITRKITVDRYLKKSEK